MAVKRALPPTHPGEILREDVLPALGLSVVDVSKKLGVTRQTLHRIMARENPRPVTPEMAAAATARASGLTCKPPTTFGTPSAESIRARSRRFRRRSKQSHQEEARMKFERITIDSAQMGGVPCIRGLRIPVATIVGMIADGVTEQDVLSAYPDLEREDIHEALNYVKPRSS